MLSGDTNDLGGLWLTCIDVDCCSAQCSSVGEDPNFRCGVCGECEAPTRTDTVMLAAIESETTKITLGVDSGAAVTCLKPDEATDYPLVSVEGRRLTSANGASITSYGDRHVGLCGSDGRVRTLRCGVADVKKEPTCGESACGPGP